VRRLPGAFGDAFRAVEVIPGVVPLATGFPYLFVRGATPSSSGYFLDGIRIPFLFHVGIGPSVINPVIIDRVDLYPGGYPARYGRYVGGIVAATTGPPHPALRAEATLRLFDAGAFIESPLLGGRASAFAGGRYSYTAPLLTLLAETVRISYWDYQAGATLNLTPRDSLRVFAFGSDDYLGEVDGEDERELFAARFHRVELRFERKPPSDSEDAAREPTARTALSLGADHSGLGEEGVMSALSCGIRTDVEVPIVEAVRLRAGTDLSLIDHDVVFSEDPPAPEPGELPDRGTQLRRELRVAFPSRAAGAIGAYVDAVVRPAPFVELVPGLRLDLFHEGPDSIVALDPRAAARVGLLSRVTSVTTFGLAHQRPSALLPLPGGDPRAIGRGLQQATQVSQGIELALPEDVTASAAFFHHTYSNLTDLTATCSAQVDYCSIFDRADGRAFGLELLIARPMSKRLGGLVSYTLSRSERTVRGRTFTGDFDRTHVLHVAAGYAIGRGYHAAARMTAYSGRPHSLLAFDDPEDPQEPTLVGKRNALRRPAFIRVDLRFEKRWRIGQAGWLSLILEGMNVTLQKETVDFDCRIAKAAGSGLSCGGQEIGPVFIPSVGVSGGF
jgi:hypothetical protein